jgi:5-methylthioadenosine/S-adenosylhomocysteine deaminase
MKFEDPAQGYVRYREDHSVNDSGEITGVRSRLTLVGQTREHPFKEDVLLSRSRYLAPATQSLRFYKEFFKHQKTFEIEKNRMRYLVTYKETEFFINVDNFTLPNWAAPRSQESYLESTGCQEKSPIGTGLDKSIGRLTQKPCISRLF